MRNFSLTILLFSLFLLAACANRHTHVQEIQKTPLDPITPVAFTGENFASFLNDDHWKIREICETDSCYQVDWREHPFGIEGQVDSGEPDSPLFTLGKYVFNYDPVSFRPLPQHFSCPDFFRVLGPVEGDWYLYGLEIRSVNGYDHGLLKIWTDRKIEVITPYPAFMKRSADDERVLRTIWILEETIIE